MDIYAICGIYIYVWYLCVMYTMCMIYKCDICVMLCALSTSGVCMYVSYMCVKYLVWYICDIYMYMCVAYMHARVYMYVICMCVMLYMCV